MSYAAAFRLSVRAKSILICQIHGIYTTIDSFPGQCRHLEFTATRAFKGKRLVNHLIHTVDVMDEDLCRILCFSDYNCVSYNFMAGKETAKRKCELNNSTHEEHKEDLEENLNYVHRGATVRMIVKSPIRTK